MSPFLALELVGIGAGAGALGALLGVGGGVILVPALVLVAGLPFTDAVGTSLVCVVATSVAGSAVQFTRGRVDVGTAVELQFFAVAGAVGAGLLAPWIPTRVLYLAFALLLVVAAWRSWPASVEAPRRAPGAPRPFLPPAGALGGGAVASLLGVGGGIIFTPLLHLVLGHDFHRAAATSVYIIGVTAGSGALVYLARGDVALGLVTPTMLGVLGGATVAAALSQRVDARWLKRAFAALLMYVAVRMVTRGISGAA
jgi:uncharacterized membrane protein YfcA